MRTVRSSVAVVALLAGAFGAAGAVRPAGPEVQRTVRSADGVPIAFEVHGQGSPALVFIHGWSGNRSFWNEQVSAFAPTNLVVTVDLAGHGASGAGRTQWTMAAFGQDVRAVVEALDLRRVVLIGHSMGGVVALEAARALPGRVVGVVGVDTLQDAGARIDPKLVAAMLAGFEKDFRGACEGFVRSMFPAQAEPALVARTRDRMCAARPGIAVAMMRQLFAYDLGAGLRAAGAPVRCINSDTYPTNVKGNRAYADFDVVVMKGVGHFPFLERPAEFDRVLAGLVASLAKR